jgi:hypothetical protein
MPYPLTRDPYSVVVGLRLVRLSGPICLPPVLA